MILFLVACLSTVDRGTVSVCLDDDRPGVDFELDFAGTVSAVGRGECGTELVIDDGAGTTHTLGFGAVDADHLETTATLDIAEGTHVSLHYVYRMVWGDVAGFALYDDERLLVAADEGTWGGAISDDEAHLGFTVEYGDKLGTEATECMPVDGYSMVFNAEHPVEIEPIGSAPIQVAGAEYQALAVAAWKWGESTGCQMSDTTDRLAWMVTR